MYSVDYLERLQQAVEEFQGAFEAWMDTQVESNHMESRGILPTVWSKGSAEANVVKKLELELAEKAGLASVATQVTGSYIGVQGLGSIDPIANWTFMSSPKAPLSPRDVRMTVVGIKGRLSAMLLDAQAAEETSLPAFSPANLHPVVWSAAAAQWTAHQYRVAVAEAAEGLTHHWKSRLGREDADATKFWQETLSPGDPSPGRPKLRYPGSDGSKSVKARRVGMEHLAKCVPSLAVGLNLPVRNVAAHDRTHISEQEAIEQLGAYSFLARLLDECNVLEVPSRRP